MPTSSKSLCLPETRRHFWVSATRLYFAETFPRKISLNWFMPALVNMSVGSFFITIGAEEQFHALWKQKNRGMFCEFLLISFCNKKLQSACFSCMKKLSLPSSQTKLNFN